MDIAKETHKEITLYNCYIQESKLAGYGLENLTNTHTKLSDSPKKFDLTAAPTAVVDIGSLDQITDLQVNQKITVRGKVISLEEPASVFFQKHATKILRSKTSTLQISMM